MNDAVIKALEQELAGIDSKIDQLERYRTSIKNTIEARNALDGFVQPGTAPYQPQPVRALTEGPVNRKEQPNTLDMARTVLRNAGTEKSPDDLKVMIRTTYGIDPAKTLDQMLYKRASAGREFYKTEDGRFGLLELRKAPLVQDIRTPSTVSA
jgi:hypothetical protein